MKKEQQTHFKFGDNIDGFAKHITIVEQMH